MPAWPVGAARAAAGARVEQLAGLARDDVRVEVRQQPDPRDGRLRRRRVAGQRPGRHALELDGLQVVRRRVEQRDRPLAARCEPPGEVRGRGGPVGVQVARAGARRDAVAPSSGTEAGQPAVRVGVGDLAARGPARSTARPGGRRCSSAGAIAATGPGTPPSSPRPPTGPARSRSASVSSSTVSSASARASPMPAMTSSASSGVKRTPSGCPGTGLRQGRQRARPHREVGRGQEVDGAARAERLHERPIDPQRTLDVGAREAGSTRDRDLARLEDLRVRADERPGDLVGVRVRRGLDERAAIHAARGDPSPGQR